MMEVKTGAYVRFFLLAIILLACIEPIEFDIPAAPNQIVIQGHITDQAPPYYVEISQAKSINSEDTTSSGISGLTVTLYDDLGQEDLLAEISPGVYETSGGIRGDVGRAYHIVVESSTGERFESIPDTLIPAGKLERIHFAYDRRRIDAETGELNADVFNVYVDAKTDPSINPYVRWRFSGTYKVLTFPESRITVDPSYPEPPLRDPLPCSGYIVVEFIPGGKLEQIADCTCCECWAEQYELAPQVNDDQFVANGQFKKVKVGEVPITGATFYDKYLVQVEQLSMSRYAYDYFRLLKSQKNNSSSLFQPPTGELKGNIIGQNTDQRVTGLFWASSTVSDFIFITQEDVPYPVTPINAATEACYDVYPNATTEPPKEWYD
ncbi:MAG: hypothetical protein ACJAZM_002400 [Cyclobacteriaceae bacterium]|jgi:hypothetical protein